MHESGDGTTFSVTGGVGSISYTLAEIAEAGVRLGRLAQRMEPLVDRLQSEWRWLGEVAQGAPVYPHEPLADMQNAWWSCQHAQADAERLAAKVVQASANYAATEAQAANAAMLAGKIGALQEGQNARNFALVAPWATALTLKRQRERLKNEGLRDYAELLLNNGGAAIAGALGSGASLAYLLAQLRHQDADTAGVRPAFALRKFLDAAAVTRSGNVAFRQVPTQEWDTGAKQWPPGHAIADPSAGEPWEVEASIRGMLAGSQDAYGYPPSSIGVVRIVRPDGRVSWVVHLPGTEDWSAIDSTNIFDMEGNLEGMTAAGKDRFMQRHVLVQEFIKQSLKSAGALPTEDVLLTGHSGGGIHAAAAAADPGFLENVNVRMIVIAGAPAKNADVVDTVSVLALENDADPVPALDYGPPPGSPNRVTVTSHRPPVAESGLGAAVQGAHSLENYLQDATTLDSSPSPAVQASQQTLRGLLGAGIGTGAGAGPMVQGTKFVFQGRDSGPGTKKSLHTAERPLPGKGKDYSPGAR